jgi:hypothetical protein
MARLNDDQTNEVSQSITDSISQFIKGKFKKGVEKIKEVNELVKNKLVNT